MWRRRYVDLPSETTLTYRSQVRFSLSSSPVFTRTDSVTDSERFYSSVLDLLEDPDEIDEVNGLLEWWNR
jgi:hypothetical protein